MGREVLAALQSIDLQVNKGEYVALMGPSGSGKSTLMNILGGLDRPTAGKIRVDGQDLLKMPDSQLNKYRREKVGFVWQQSTRNLVPYLNAIRNANLIYPGQKLRVRISAATFRRAFFSGMIVLGAYLALRNLVTAAS
mgnify:CR=1 FL=1